jgi:hypothetical protein
VVAAFALQLPESGDAVNPEIERTARRLSRCETALTPFGRGHTLHGIFDAGHPAGVSDFGRRSRREEAGL